MKPFDLVAVKPEFTKNYEHLFKEKTRLIFLGEINQMPGHGVFVSFDGNVLTGLHVDSFSVVPEDEA